MAMLKLFYWQGLNALRQTQKGSIVAESKQQAQFLLLNKGLTEIKLQQNWQLQTEPKNAEICALLSQLATLLQSSIPLKNSLQILQSNCTQIRLNQWLRELIAHIESGHSFSQSLTFLGKYLNHQEIQLIQVGEMTGKLATVCSKIAEYRNQSLQLQRKLQKIMLYPLLVLGISLSLTIVLLIFIVPQFAEMYSNNQAALPTFTQILLSLSQFLQHYFVHSISLILLGIVVFKYKLKQSIWLNQRKQQLINKLPLFGKISQLSRLVSFSHSLCLMLQSGVPLNQALNSFLPQSQSWQKQPIQGDPILIAEVQTILQWVSQGYHFSASVSSNLFPIEAQQMLEIGEKSGKFALMLQHIATSYQNKLDHQIDLLSQLLEPLLMLIIGGLIGLIMMGMYLPIFNMGSVLQ